jgi:alpha-N-arabinofuranosidase
LMLPITVASTHYMMAGKKLEAVSASASKDKTGTVHISLVNIDAHAEQDVMIQLGDVTAKSVTGRILRSDKLQDYNTFDSPQKVQPASFSGASLTGAGLSVKMPPFSVVVLELK